MKGAHGIAVADGLHGGLISDGKGSAAIAFALSSISKNGGV